ncbi:MAG: BamA/TamA family outer membrane protein [Myxococcales bacterium]|nr:BamA/TamA family outer membrane protein [Myxococcales bacterium]MDH3484920.1 BamA/TamA family outer membrane protein [Myxococcales bacterium]
MARQRCICLLLVLASGCKTIPEDSYGIDKIRFSGMENLDPEALQACLASHPRDRVTIAFGTSVDRECGVPPFDGKRASFDLWRKLRKGWPTLDSAVFERDLDRIERWYKARGYYDAAVVSSEFDPPSAATSDRIVVGPDGDAWCEREGEDEGCELEIGIEIEEGLPVLVRSIDVVGHEGWSPENRSKIERAIALEIGKPFDEALYERSKREIRRQLRDASYACGRAWGRVEIDRDAREASVGFSVETGPPCAIGNVVVTGNQDLPAKTILAVADLKRGEAYSLLKLADAQRAVYALGALATVNIIDTARVDENQACTGIVDINIAVEPGRQIRWGIGAGVQSGTLSTLTLEQDTRISDVHLLGRFEHRNFIDGFRNLRIEDRPKIVATDPFFRFGRGFILGNEVRISYQRPAFIEARTTSTMRFRHDWGPDPYELFRRHDLQVSGQLSRPFLDGRLLLTGGLNYDAYLVVDQDPRFPRSYQVAFFDERIVVDLRDDSRSPRAGFFFQVGSQQSPAKIKRSWQYVRVTPEVRGYIPLPLSSTLAFKFGIGAMFLFSRDTQRLDLIGQQLGPQSYRLRSGGPTSHRGFFPGFLGDPGSVDSLTEEGNDARNDGGLRRWEASVEWRLPVTQNFATAFFMDFGDVNRGKFYRFNYIRAAAGFGFRYQTPVGPIRLDFGFLIPKWQVVGEPPPPNAFNIFRFIRGGAPGAIQFTIGEAF